MVLKLKSKIISLCNRDFVHDACLFFNALLIVLFVSPIFIRNMNRIALISICALWFFFIVLDVRKKIFDSDFLLFFCLYSIWLVISFIYKIAGISTSSIGNYLVSILTFLSLLIGVYIKEYCSNKEKKFFIVFLIVVVAINCFDNIIIHIIYPEAHEIINMTYGESYLKMNVAETSFYMATIITVLFGVLLFKKGRNYLNVFLLISLVTSLAFALFIEPRATSILIFLVVILVFAFIKLKIKFKIVLAVFVVTSIVLLIVFYNKIIIALSEAKNNRIASRLLSLLQLFTGQSSGKESLTERIKLLTASAKTWTKSPLNFFFGIGDRTDYSNLYFYGIGGHSEYFDNLAKYGLVGCVFLWSGVYFYFASLLNKYDKKIYLYVLLFAAYAYCFLNNISKPNIIIPLCVGFATYGSFNNDNKQEASK